MEINPAYLALLGAIFGGGGLKVVEHFLTKDKIKDDTATNLRTELRGEIAALKTELKTVEDDLDKWRGKYYELMDQFIQVKGELDSALRAINETTQAVEVITKLPESLDKFKPE